MPHSDRPVALVTGGSSGIGEATCRLLAAQGHRVVVGGTDPHRTKTVADSVDGVAHTADVSDSGQVNAMVEAVLRDFGRLDVVVTAAGTDDPETKAVLAEQMRAGGPILRTPDLTDTAWRRLMAVNLDGTFFVVRAAVRAMLPAGRGAIVTVASGAAYETIPGYPNYAVSKAGVVALTHSVGKEMIGHGIRVNGVAPGLVKTPMLTRSPSGLKGRPGGHPHRTHAEPEDIAAVIGFLTSDAAVNIAGEIIIANGGRATA
ncbi:3-oxoacyl-ACP reductase [Pseudonocardia halophobica]|uniref:3-oxoacyl-ACP reductase n=1 Tax=Pseudonocardia halophobica TaxID=29401 RepID=A0A9W6L5G9_9PSEU|nr:SDR family oxidoreductase [Pseudonocardia halophobica]GLL14012.1 3-oxoacyl-ACP reductase [Pseudonocardia halophobica]